MDKEVEPTVEIPDETVLPHYLSRLEHDKSFSYFGATVASDFYRDPEFYYLNGNGEEISPYVEIIKEENGSFHLIGLSFVNDENIIELYMDGEDTASPVTGKLKKYVPPKEDKVKRVPREK